MPRLSYEKYKLVRIYNAIFIDLCAKNKKLNNFFIKNGKMHVLRKGQKETLLKPWSLTYSIN